MFWKCIKILFVSMLPIVELRGAIPYASILDVPLYIAFPVAIIGNMLPVPFILLFFKYLKKWLSNAPVVGKIITKVSLKAEKKAAEISTYEFLGVFIFVAIPLPGTGAWTGAVIATALGMRLKKALPAILLGVLSAGLIMSIIAYALPDVFASLFA